MGIWDISTLLLLWTRVVDLLVGQLLHLLLKLRLRVGVWVGVEVVGVGVVALLDLLRHLLLWLRVQHVRLHP